MNKRKGFRLLTALTLCVMMVCCFSVTAFAKADDTDQNLPVTDATMPEKTPPVIETDPPVVIPEGEPIEDEGNAYTRDLLYDKATNKQFITVQTKSGNTFYIVIDYDAPVNDEEEQYQTYFLNMVDEADLLALMDEEAVAELTTCVCEEHCEAGAVNTKCEVCSTDMTGCTGKEPEPPKEPTEPEKKEPAGLNPAVLLLVLAVMGGAAFAYFKFIKGKANHKNNSNPDDYDYEDGEELPDEEETELEDEESGELDADRGGGEESEDDTP